MQVEKVVDVEIIVGIPVLVKVTSLSIQNILEVLFAFLAISKRESVTLQNSVITSSFMLYVFIHYPITSLILAFQLALNLMTASHSSCHHLTLYVMIY